MLSDEKLRVMARGALDAGLPAVVGQLVEELLETRLELRRVRKENKALRVELVRSLEEGGVDTVDRM